MTDEFCPLQVEQRMQQLPILTFSISIGAGTVPKTFSVVRVNASAAELSLLVTVP